MLVPVATVLIIVVCFSFFQVLIWENGIELVASGILFGGLSFAVFAYSLRDFASKDLGFTKADWKKQVAYGTIIGISLFVAFSFYRLLFYPTEGSSFSLQFVNFLGIPIILAISAAEEFFFRGYAIPMLERGVNTLVSSVVSAILFILYHQTALFRFLVGIQSSSPFFDYEYMAILFAGSLLLSYLFVKKRSLVMPVTVHFVWNLLIFAGTPLEGLPLFP